MTETTKLETIDETKEVVATTSAIVSMEEEYYNNTIANIKDKMEYIKKLKVQEKKI